MIRMTCALMALGVFVASAAVADDDDPVIKPVREKLKDPKKPFVLVVMLKVKEGDGKKFEQAFAPCGKATRKEKGNLAYDLMTDPTKPDTYLIYEKWKSLADLEAHMKEPHLKALIEKVHEVAAGTPEFRVLLPVEPPQ